MVKRFWQTGAGAFFAALSFVLPLQAQTSACSVHDQLCIYHGIGKQMGYNPSGSTSITATANWDQANDADLHALLPTGNTYSAPTEALPGYPLQISEPFFPDVSGAHIYPNHYESQINGGAATATHSGDAGGGLAPYPGQPGCDPAFQSSVTCEAIAVQGDVPSGVYSYALHAFPASGSSFPLTNFSLDVRASGNMVLVTNTPNVINPITGLIQQTGSFQGAGATTSQLDVFALNVGHAGHVGGVTIPTMTSYLDGSGVQRYQPAEPLLFDETPNIQDQIAGAFLQRDAQVAYYEALREQEKQRRAYEAALAQQRALERQRLAAIEKAQKQQAANAELADLSQCNPKYASCLPAKKVWTPPKDWSVIVSEVYQQSVVLPKKPAEVRKEDYALYTGVGALNTPSCQYTIDGCAKVKDNSAYYFKVGGCSHGKCTQIEYYKEISGDTSAFKFGFGGGIAKNNNFEFGIAQSLPREGNSATLTFGGEISKRGNYAAQTTIEFFGQNDYEISLAGSYRGVGVDYNLTSGEMAPNFSIGKGYSISQTMINQTYYFK